jgi:hydroxymethylpyrimidine pyrophosphatase-like HAD family hydrolase
MKRRLIAFDLDGTLAVTKSAISDVMAARLKDLLSLRGVCDLGRQVRPVREAID